ncbi:ankyrin, partial [Trematosphaeria pertusa]
GNPLSIAALSRDLEMARQLLEAGANPNTPCPRYGSAIHAAYCHQSVPCDFAELLLPLLISHGADINVAHVDRGTILTSLARISEDKSVTRIAFLIDRGADCNLTGGSLHTPLIVAAASSGPQSLEIMQLLLKSGAKLDIYGGIYGSPLLAAT